MFAFLFINCFPKTAGKAALSSSFPLHSPEEVLLWSQKAEGWTRVPCRWTEEADTCQPTASSWASYENTAAMRLYLIPKHEAQWNYWTGQKVFSTLGSSAQLITLDEDWNKMGILTREWRLKSHLLPMHSCVEFAFPKKCHNDPIQTWQCPPAPVTLCLAGCFVCIWN